MNVLFRWHESFVEYYNNDKDHDIADYNDDNNNNNAENNDNANDDDNDTDGATTSTVLDVLCQRHLNNDKHE